MNILILPYGVTVVNDMNMAYPSSKHHITMVNVIKHVITMVNVKNRAFDKVQKQTNVIKFKYYINILKNV